MDGIMMEEGSSGTAARGIAGQNRTEQTDSHDQTRHGSGGGAGVAQSAEGRLCTGQSGMSVATLAREGHVLRSQDGWMVLLVLLPTACCQDESMEAESQFPEPKSAA